MKKFTRYKTLAGIAKEMLYTGFGRVQRQRNGALDPSESRQPDRQNFGFVVAHQYQVRTYFKERNKQMKSATLVGDRVRPLPHPVYLLVYRDARQALCLA